MRKPVRSNKPGDAKPRSYDQEVLHEEVDSGVYSCRICFEDSSDTSDFISPCKCTGTQKYVHFKCLRRWQENIVNNGDTGDVRAYHCSVCCAPYSVQPPKVAYGYSFITTLKGLAGALCISMLVFGLSGPPWPHLALLAFLLLGTRSHLLLVLLVLLLGSMLVTMHTRGVRLVLRIDNNGRLGLAIIRHGARVDGIRAGSLLVASDQLDSGIFRKSVVLLYDHSSRGAKGVILTHPLPVTDALLPHQMRGGDRQQGGGRIHHFLGGPVGMPGDGPAQELVIVHTVQGVAGAQRLVLPMQGQAEAEQPELYVGGSLTEVAEKVLHGASAGGTRENHMWVFHGICAWAGGQLEGEIRTNSWGFHNARLHHLTATAPDALWRQLKDDDGTTWIG